MCVRKVPNLGWRKHWISFDVCISEVWVEKLSRIILRNCRACRKIFYWLVQVSSVSTFQVQIFHLLCSFIYAQNVTHAKIQLEKTLWSLHNYVQLHSLLRECSLSPAWCMYSSSKPRFIKLKKNILCSKNSFMCTQWGSPTHREKSRPLALRNMLHRRQQWLLNVLGTKNVLGLGIIKQFLLWAETGKGLLAGKARGKQYLVK